uniref:Uncharacterized protein n=1 Tax=Oryza glumipatula TaxID=40148 RepID=A0A0D9Y944_9ORYZ
MGVGCCAQWVCISFCSPSKLQSISLPNSIHLLWRLRRRTARVCSPCSKLGVQSSAEELKSTNEDLKQLHKVHQAGPECHFGLGGL